MEFGMKLFINIAVFIAVLTGWILNLVTLFSQAFGELTINFAELGLRLMGVVVVPLGTLLGFI